MTPRDEINPRTGESYNNVMAEIAREKADHATTWHDYLCRYKEDQAEARSRHHVCLTTPRATQGG
jgi:1,2-phenylacetyl-CoA epoxidase catalytic subunit